MCLWICLFAKKDLMVLAIISIQMTIPAATVILCVNQEDATPTNGYKQKIIKPRVVPSPILPQIVLILPSAKGGFGACQYANPNVCVRVDRIETGSCAAVCNWACCAYQK